MLKELRATGVFYDPHTDATRVFVSQPPGTVRTHTVAANLLLDAQGFLVGVDVEPEAPTRTIVMIGPHEKVARTTAARVGLCATGTGDVFEVRIARARATIQGDKPNPYA